jgi:putative cell wall-binding protein
MQGYSRPRLAVAAVAASAASLGGLTLGAASAHAAATITVGLSGATYNTIAAGISHASAGDTVVVSPGTYNETLSLSNKTGVTVVSSTIGGAQVNKIVVNGSGNAVVNGFKVANFKGTAIDVGTSDGAVIENNTVTGSGQASDDTTLVGTAPAGSNGLPAVGLSGAVTFTHNAVTGSAYHGVLVSGVGGATVSYNEVSSSADTNVDTAARYAAGISVKAPNVLVSSNYSHDNQDSGIQFYPGAAVNGDHGIAVNNLIVNNHDHGIDNLKVTAGTIINNTIVHNETAGINVEGIGSGGGYVIENNLVSDNAFQGTAANRSKGEIRIAQDATLAGGVTVNNNLLYESAVGGGVYYVWDSKGATGTTVQNPGADIFYQATGPFTATVKAFSSFATDTLQGGKDKVANPSFTSDYHVGAAAAGMADQAVAHKPGTDKDGNGWAGSAGAYNAGSTSGPVTTGPIAGSTPAPGTGPSVGRVGGGDRFDTGVRLSAKGFPNGGAKDVIIATGWKFPDALSGVPLAKKLNAPLLLVDSNNPAANDAVKTEIARVLASGGVVHVLGGPAAVPDAVVKAVTPANATSVRIAGATRFDTSVEIAKALGNPKNVVVARGDDGPGMTGFADALSAGPYAANVFGGGNAAVLLTNNTALDPAVKTYLSGATSIQAVGGPARDALTNAGVSAQPAIWGANRYDTAAKVAAKFSGEKVAGVAVGLKFPDALTGAAYLANNNGPLVLTTTDALPDETRLQLATIGQALGVSGTITVFGGTQVITEAVRTAIATASGGHTVG